MAHLGEVNSERRKINSVMARQRATERALGSLERARNIVNAAPYVYGKNTAVWAAIHSDPPYIPGTEVRVQQVGPPDSDWFMLRSAGHFQRATRLAQIFLRQRSPITSFNLFVADHPVGVSGSPRGRIHSNKKLKFMFPWGTYRDSVSASEGYEFEADASPENTRIWGPSNASAAPMNNVLSSVNFSDLQSKASTLNVSDDLLAEVRFQGSTTKIDLYTPKSRILMPRIGTRRVFSGFTSVTEKRRVRTYTDVPYRIKVPTYTVVTESITKKRPVYTWLSSTKTRREAVYEDRKEHYYERDKVWGTKLVARTTFESQFIDSNGQRAEQLARELLDYVRQIQQVEGTSTSSSDPLLADLLLEESVKRTSIDLLREEKHCVKVLEILQGEPSASDYDNVDQLLAWILSERSSNEWIANLTFEASALVDGFYNRVSATKTLAASEKTGGASKDFGDLRQVDLEQLERIRKAGSKHGNKGMFELRALHEYVEIPYVVTTKLFRKTRLKRVKTGERLVTFVEKTRRFSHNETKHILRKRKIFQGQSWVVRTRRVPTGWTVQSQTVLIPQYTDQSYTYYEEVVIPRTLARTETVPSNGTIYIEKEIEKLGGDLEGKLTIVTNSKVKITDSIRYIDSSGRKRMLYGIDPSEDYEFNPDYDGQSVLLMISRGDITYSKTAPKKIEINGTLVSTQGKVAMEGIELSPDGSEIRVNDDVTANPAQYIKDSLRRLGGIISRERPVAAYVDSTSTVIAGFAEGQSKMDRNLMLEAGGITMPPNSPQLDRPIWTLRTIGKKIDVTN